MKEGNLKPELFVSSFDEKNIRDCIEKLNTIQDIFGMQQPILIHIDSYGGNVFGLIMLYEHLISMGNPIVTYTTSKAMSAGAFLLAMAGSPGMRFASPNSQIMVHEMQGSAFPDDMKNIENNVENMKKLNTTILNIFAKSIGCKDATAIRELIKSRSVGHELYLSANEALELGLVDHVAYIKISPVIAYNIIQLVPGEDVEEEAIPAPAPVKSSKKKLAKSKKK